MSCDRCKETLEEIEQLRSECDELRSECDILRELEDDFDREKRKFKADIEKLTKVSKQSLEHLQREKKAADVLRTKLKRLETQKNQFSANQITLERRNDDFQQESRVLKARLRALEEKIEADLEESVFVKYELEDVRDEYEHLKQEHLEDLGAANAIQLRCNTLSAEVAAKADVIKNLNSSNKSLEKTLREMIEAQEKSSIHKTLPTRNKKKPPRISLLSVLPSLKRPRPQSAEGSPRGSMRSRRRSMRNLSIDFRSDVPPIDAAAAAAAQKLAQKLSNDVATRSTSAPVPRVHQKLDPNLLRRSLQDLYSVQQLQKSTSSDTKDNSPYLPTVDEEEPPPMTELMCDSPSPPRRVKKSQVVRGGNGVGGNGAGHTGGNENPEHAADTDASTDEMDVSTLSEDELNLGSSASNSRSSSSSSKCAGAQRTLTYGAKSAERAENPEEGSNTDMDMHDQGLLLSRSSLVGNAIKKVSASSLSKKRKRSPRKSDERLGGGGVFRAELVEQANQIAMQIQRFSESLHEASVISDVQSCVSPIKSPPSKRHSGLDRTHADADAAASSSSTRAAPPPNGVIDDTDAEAEADAAADLLPMAVFEDLALASLSLLASNAATDYSPNSADENGDLDSLSRSEDFERTKGSRIRALFRMINSRRDSTSSANGALSSYDDLEERLEMEIAARQDAEAQNDALIFELQRSRAEIRDLQILLERLSTDDEAMATAAPTPTPAPSSPRKQSLAGGADAMLPFSLMDSSMLPPAHQSSQAGSQPHTLRRGRSAHASLLSNGDRVSRPASLRRSQTSAHVSPILRGGRGSQPPSLRRGQITGVRVSPHSVGLSGASVGVGTQPASLRRGANSHVSPQLSCSPMGQLPSPLLRGHASGGSRSLLARNAMIRSPVSQPIVSPSGKAFDVSTSSLSQKSSDGDKTSISVGPPKARRVRKPSSLTRLLSQDDNAGGSSATFSAASSAASSKQNSAATSSTSSSTDARESRPTPEPSSTSSEARSATRRSAAETRSFLQMTRGLKMPCKPKSNEQKRRLRLADLLPPEAVPTRTPNGSHSNSSNSSNSINSSSSNSSSSKPSSASASTSSSSSSYDLAKNFTSRKGVTPAQVLSPISTSSGLSSSPSPSPNTDQIVKSVGQESPSLAVSSSRPQPQKIDAQKAASDFLRKAAMTAKSKSAWPSRESNRGSIGNALMSTVKPVASTSSTDGKTSAKPASSISPPQRRNRRSVPRQAKSMLPSPQTSVAKRKQEASKARESESNSPPRTPASRTSHEAVDAPISARSAHSTSSNSTKTTPRSTLKKQNSASGPSMKHSRRSLPSALTKSKSSRNVARPRSSFAMKKKPRALVELHSRTSAPSSRRSSQQDDVTLPITPDLKPAQQQQVKTPTPSRVLAPRRTPRGSGVSSPGATASVIARRDSPSAEGGVRRPASKRSNDLLRRLKAASTAPAPIPTDKDGPRVRSPVRPPRPDLHRPKSSQADTHPLRHKSLASMRNRRKSSALAKGLVTRATSPKLEMDAPTTPSPQKRSSLSKGFGLKSKGKRGVTPPSSRRPASATTSGVGRSGARSACVSRRSSGVGDHGTVGRGESLRSLIRTPTPELPPSIAAPEEAVNEEEDTGDVVMNDAVKSPSQLKTPSPLAFRQRTVLRPASSVKSGIRMPRRSLKR